MAREFITYLKSRFAGRADSEHIQILIRIVGGIAGTAYVIVMNALSDTVYTYSLPIRVLPTLGIALGGVLFLSHLIYSPGVNFARRWLGIFHDSVLLSVTIFLLEDDGIPVFGMYIWVVIGNGFRYGPRYLYGASALTLVMFYIVAYFNQYHFKHMGVLILATFLLAVVIPVYMGSLLKSLQRSLEKAREADHLKTRFLSNVSHDLRTPLNAILANSELLSHGLAADSRQARQLRDMQDAGATLNRLVTDLLDVARIEAGRLVISPSWFNLAELLGRVARFNRPAADRAGTRIQLAIDGDVPVRVRGDAVRLEQVLNNLVSNAVKYTGDGEVRIIARPRQDPGDGRCTGVVCLVRDNGIGMEPDAIERIFNRFEQVDASAVRQRSGAGLGLSIARELVELMGGSIEVESAPGEGSCFTVSIPLDVDAGFVPDLFSEPLLPRLVVICGDEPGRMHWGGVFDGKTLPRADVLVLHEARESFSAIRGRVYEPLCLVVDAKGLEARAEDVPGLLTGEGAGNGDPESVWVMVNAPAVNVEQASTAGRAHGYLCRVGGAAVDDVRKALGIAVWSMSPGATVMAGPEEQLSDRLRGITVLVADDNELNRRVFVDMLDYAGARVVEARNGAEALDKLVEGAADVGLLDVQMPDLTGIEVMRAYVGRCSGKRVPLIALTADTTDECRADCLAAGAEKVLYKPVDMTSLYRALRDVVAAGESDRPLASLPVSVAGRRHGLLDYGVLYELGAAGRRADYIPSLVQCFKQDGERLLEALREASGARDISASRMLLHRMKGMSGSIGAGALAAFCHDMLSLPDERLRRSVPDIAEALSRLHCETVALLDGFIAARA